MTCGIYKITNLLTNQCYIGQSVNIEKRWNSHKMAIDTSPLHQDIQSLGIENFSFEIIEKCSQKDLNDKERYWINYYNSFVDGYNSTLGGAGTSGSISLTYGQVLEIRELLATTELTNIEIAAEYNVSENAICGINTGYYWFEEGLDYPIRKRKEQQSFYCVDCGKKISFGATRCIECAGKAQRKIKHPNAEKLQKILFENNGNFSKVGRLFCVTDNAIRKWCKNYNLPTHSSDYQIKKVTIQETKTGKNLPSIRVQQIDKKTGEIIQEFESLTQAEKLTGIDHITQASDPNNTTRKSAGGYIWKRIS